MHIAHIALWTEDIDRLADFYATYFGALTGERYVNPAKGFSSRFLSFSNGARIELMHSSALPPRALGPGAPPLGLAHFAFAVGDETEVDTLTRRLREHGHAVLDGPRRTGDGYYESVVLDPDGNRVEITV